MLDHLYIYIYVKQSLKCNTVTSEAQTQTLQPCLWG